MSLSFGQSITLAFVIIFLFLSYLLKMNPIKAITRRIRAKKVREQIKNSQVSVLDIGCDNGYFARSLSPTAYGIDIKYGWDVESESLSKFKEYSFDYIVMLAVIEHLKDYKRVLQRCSNLLKKNGKIVLTTPSEKAEKFMLLYDLMGDYKEHVRYFVKKDFENIMGFKLLHYSTFEFGFNQLIVLEKK